LTGLRKTSKECYRASIPFLYSLLTKKGVYFSYTRGQFDLADNNLIVTSQSLSAVETMIASDRNGGAWTGSRIVTSMPPAVSQLTTLAAATAGNVGKTTHSPKIFQI
jgi:hypothetical protein